MGGVLDVKLQAEGQFINTQDQHLCFWKEIEIEVEREEGKHDSRYILGCLFLFLFLFWKERVGERAD